MALPIVLSDLAAIGGVNHIKWSWSIVDPNQNGLPYLEAEATEVWVAEVNNRELAFKAGEGLIDFIQAGLGLGQTFYGWIRARARNGEFTEFEPVDVASGVAGTVSAGGTGITLPDDSVLPQHLDADTAPKQLLMRDRLNFVSRAGDTMTGLLNLSGAPTANPHATTKQYVDENIAAALANVAFDGQYTVKTVLTEADPGTGNMQFNTANQFDATELYISAIGAGGNDLSNLWRKVDVGRVITMQQANDASKNVKFDVTGPAVDHVTWFTIPVATVSFNNMPIANNIDVLMHVSGSTGDQYYLPLAGGTMTGALTLSGAPTVNLHAATKQYVDDAVTAGGGYSDEQAQDAVAAMLVAGSNITLTYNDVANTLTIASSGGVDTAASYMWTGTHQFTSTVRIDNAFTLGGTNPNMTLKAAAGANTGTFIGQKDNKNRWSIQFPNSDAESSGDLGSNLRINRWNDAGDAATAVMTIYRYTGLLEHYGDISINRPTGNAALNVTAAAGAASTRISSAAGFTAVIDTNPGTGTAVGALRALRAGALRWSMEYPNASDNFSLKRYPDAVEVIGIDRTTGLITVENNVLAVTAPSAGGHLTNKTYVDGAISTAGGSYQPLDADLTSIAGYASTGKWLYRSAADTWAEVTVGTGLSFASGSLTCTVSTAGLAPLASPAFTGTPTAPTAAAGTNTTQIATTAFVATSLGSYLPLTGGDLSGDLRIIKATPALTLRKNLSGETSVLYGEKGASKRWGLHLGNGAAESTGDLGSIFAIERFNDAGSSLGTPFTIDRDTGIVGILNGITVPATPGAGNEATSKSYVDSVDALKAPLASPALTGTPTAPTAAEGVTTTQLATCAFVNNALVGNYLSLTAGSSTILGNLIIDKASPYLILDKTASGQACEFRSMTAGLLRWRMMYGSADAEVTEPPNTNVGSNFILQRYNDAGTFIAASLTINRASGAATFEQIVVGAPTGGALGAGNINAKGVYDDNVLLTCYVLDAARNGRVDTERFDKLSRTGENTQAKAFTARLDELDVRAYARKWRATPGPLPGFPPLPADGPVENDTPLGQWINKTMECLELQAVHIAQLSDEIDVLRTQLAAMGR